LRFYAAWVDEADRRAADAIASAMPRPDPSRRKPRNSYERLAAGLRAAIKSGQLAPGELLPTVVELAAEHDPSTGTVYRAVALLEAEGLVDVQRGEQAIVTTEVEGTRR
jgi:DNA-binding GntR family transcriptional regulator